MWLATQHPCNTSVIHSAFVKNLTCYKPFKYATSITRKGKFYVGFMGRHDDSEPWQAM
jgi:hypothetical protein